MTFLTLTCKQQQLGGVRLQSSVEYRRIDESLSVAFDAIYFTAIE